MNGRLAGGLVYWQARCGTAVTPATAASRRPRWSRDPAYDAVRGWVKVGELQLMQVKGRKALEQIYELKGLKNGTIVNGQLSIVNEKRPFSSK